LLFGVDRRGALHWLYPAYTDGATSPQSVRLSPGAQDGVMTDSVQLESPAPGALTVFALVTREPLSVREIEGLPPAALSARALQERWPSASVRVKTLSIRERHREP
jgi:hypothetical protein